jgi:hypothetical protein
MIAIFIFLMIVSLNGCDNNKQQSSLSQKADKPQSKAKHAVDPVTSLNKSVSEYWKARIEGRIERLYEMEEPAYRQKASLKDYTRRFGNMLDIQNFNILNVQVKEDLKEDTVAFVKLNLTVKFNVAIPGLQGRVQQQEITDNWVRIGETWYHQTPASSPAPSQPPALQPSPPAS